MFTRPRMAISLALAAAATVLPGLTGTAHADITRCVGAVGVEGAHACYTSPRFNNSGITTVSLAEVPVVCYGIGCTGATLAVYAPGGTVGGRFTTVSYLGADYTVYRPADGQPYVVKTSASALQPLNDVQALLISVALDASK